MSLINDALRRAKEAQQKRLRRPRLNYPFDPLNPRSSVRGAAWACCCQLRSRR